jgi:hypothetical protein
LKTFKITGTKVLGYLTGPVIMIFLTFGIVYYLTPDFSLLQYPVALTLFCVVFFCYSAGPVILLINHYKFFKGCRLEYHADTETFKFSSHSSEVQFEKTDISGIKQLYARTGSIPWQYICIWEIYLREAEVAAALAPILISKKDVRRIFSGIKTKREHEFFVSL